MLLLILMAIPLTGTLLLFIGKDKSNKIPFIVNLAMLGLSSFILRNVFMAMPLNYKLEVSGPFVFNLKADPLSSIFIILSVFLWFIISIYSPKYMEYEGKIWSFQLSTMLTLFSVLGIFLAGNLLTMLLFFELMTITSYFWVIHKWDKQAIKAGYFYLFFSIMGGLLIALAIAMMDSATEVLPDIGSGIAAVANPKLFAWSMAILIAGFGIKAGMAPLHLWLPYAHSVAPSPGSALLSGLLIKVGAYGIIRTGEIAGWGVELAEGLKFLGPLIIILGTITMLLGVMSALIQSNAKKLLAYHSISQMGYIILGIGLGFYAGTKGGLALSGAIYHIINHGLFKVALFLGVGIIYLHTGETDLYKLGGLGRRFPVTAVLMFIAILGITGVPGLNGYGSKLLLYHGINIAGEMGSHWIIWLEGLFLLVGVGTVASFSKLFYLIFLGEKTELVIEDRRTSELHLAIALLTIAMLGIGIKPQLLLNLAIIPGIKTLGIRNTTSLADIPFWEIRNILDMIMTLIFGIMVCWAGLKTGAFHRQPPTWLTIEGAIRLLGIRISAIRDRVMENYGVTMKKVQNIIQTMGIQLHSSLHKFDQSKSSTVFGIKLAGISADIIILALVLITLLALYTWVNIFSA